MSTKTKTAAWGDVRAKRPVDASAVSEHVARMEAEERAYRLREITRLGVTQKELADRMAITAHRLALESGDLDRSGLATLKSYVKALGGSIEVTATFGNRRLFSLPGHNIRRRPIHDQRGTSRADRFISSATGLLPSWSPTMWTVARRLWTISLVARSTARRP